MPAYRILLMLGRSPFARSVTRNLANRGINICGMVFDEVGPASEIHQSIKIQQPRDQVEVMEELAGNRALPVIYSKSLSMDVLGTEIEVLDPDIILICCYPKILPEQIWQLPRLVCLNLHPSLLPKYRGPDPLFWQLKYAEARFGISLHRVGNEVDGGDIVAQDSCKIVDGTNRAELEEKLGDLGGDLVEAAIKTSGFLRNPFTPQDVAQASYQSFPCAVDFRLDTGWPARRAYNFLCGTQHYGETYVLDPVEACFTVSEVVDFSEKDQLPQGIFSNNRSLMIQFGLGSVELIGELQGSVAEFEPN